MVHFQLTHISQFAIHSTQTAHGRAKNGREVICMEITVNLVLTNSTTTIHYRMQQSAQRQRCYNKRTKSRIRSRGDSRHDRYIGLHTVCSGNYILCDGITRKSIVVSNGTVCDVIGRW